jgi:type II secretion system protein C
MRSGVVALSTVLGFLLLWNAGVNPMKWFTRSPQQAPEAQTKTVQSAPPTRWPQAIDGAEPQAMKPLTGTDSSISEKPLRLLLAGTLPGRNAFEGTALIGVARENVQTYAAGSILVNGARLAEIHSRYVVLERNGRSAKLYLQNLRDTPAAEAAVSNLLSVGGPQKIKPAVATVVEPITDYLRPSPVYDGANLRGYEVYPGKRGGVFYQMGLQSGDVITSIEGMPLNDPAQAFEMFRQLMDGVALAATVNRKGNIQRLTLDGGLITVDHEREKNASMNAPSPAAGLPST